MAGVLAPRQYCMPVLGHTNSVERIIVTNISSCAARVPLLTCSIARSFPLAANPCLPAMGSDLHNSDYFLISGKRVRLPNRHTKHQCWITVVEPICCFFLGFLLLLASMLCIQSANTLCACVHTFC